MIAPRRFRDFARSAIRATPGGKRLLVARIQQRTDYYGISYPKSGRTWVRFTLGTALCDHFNVQPHEPADVLEPWALARRDPRIPRLVFTHDDNAHLKRISELERSKSRYRRKNVVLLVRDPRDVVVSSYFQQTRRTQPHEAFRGTLSMFLRDQVHGLETIIEFMNIWAAARSIPRSFLLLRYEDFARDPRGELHRLVDFLGVPSVSDETIDAACRASTFENMQRLEAAGGLGERLEPTDSSDAESFKVRRGEIGGHNAYLSDEDLAYANATMARLDPWFRYTG